jgi:hypothetical protein
MSDLERWLEGLGLGRYAALFAEHDIDRDVALLDELASPRSAASAAAG